MTSRKPLGKVRRRRKPRSNTYKRRRSILNGNPYYQRRTQTVRSEETGRTSDPGTAAPLRQPTERPQCSESTSDGI